MALRWRAGDKVTLPASALEELSKQDALTKGPMLFRVGRTMATTDAQALRDAGSGADG